MSQAIASATTAAVTLGKPFLGRPIEICIVTPNLRETLAGLCKLGIGPFKIFSFNPQTISEMKFNGEPAEFEIEVAFTQQQQEGGGGMIWEVMTPVRGPSVMQEFLDRTSGKGGIQHVCFDCEDNHEAIMKEGGKAEALAEAARRRKQFEERGFSVRQSGVWHGAKGCVAFMYFDTEDAITTCFESYVFSADWEDPHEFEAFPLLQASTEETSVQSELTVHGH